MSGTVARVERDVAELVGTADVETLSAEQVVEATLEALHPEVALACSFQKEETVILDMLLERQPKARVFALDTHVLFSETYALWRELERRYVLWERNPDLCCSIRKLGPLGEALSGLSGWITGVRRDQAPSRAATAKLGWDERHELWKASPLADWTDDDVWAYVRARDLPVNPLHEHGYASIGCTHCTRPGQGREGRWAATGKTECGLHA